MKASYNEMELYFSRLFQCFGLIHHPKHWSVFLSKPQLPLLKAVVKKQLGQTIFKAGMITRILQSGWVRAGDIVEVLSTIGVS